MQVNSNDFLHGRSPLVTDAERIAKSVDMGNLRLINDMAFKAFNRGPSSMEKLATQIKNLLTNNKYLSNRQKECLKATFIFLKVESYWAEPKHQEISNHSAQNNATIADFYTEVCEL